MAGTREVYEFGPFALDVGEHRLCTLCEAVPLPRKAFDVLVALARRASVSLSAWSGPMLPWRKGSSPSISRRFASTLGCLLAAIAAACSSTVPTQPPPLADSAELQRLYEADQEDRDGPPARSIDWAAVSARDAQRRHRVRELIESGHVRTAKDYERAAMVFQHGSTPEDILMAHVLAVTALGRGNTDARWLAAATLDRFLHRVKQPQVFGTQFGKQEGQPWTMEPYNRTLIDKRVLEDNCVPDHDHQARVLDALNKGEEPPPPSRPPCADARKP